ncbi:hypothetical protein N136_03380, partial [Leifsonia aquatica ATCC 14665]
MSATVASIVGHTSRSDDRLLESVFERRLLLVDNGHGPGGESLLVSGLRLGLGRVGRERRGKGHGHRRPADEGHSFGGHRGSGGHGRDGRRRGGPRIGRR